MVSGTSDSNFEQISFVNAISTSKGGQHVNAVVGTRMLRSPAFPCPHPPSSSPFVRSVCLMHAFVCGCRRRRRGVDQVTKGLSEHIKKKFKTSTITPKMVKNHLWVFVNCLIENPRFDSQTKVNMTSAKNTFGSKWKMDEAFQKKRNTSPILSLASPPPPTTTLALFPQLALVLCTICQLLRCNLPRCDRVCACVVIKSSVIEQVMDQVRLKEQKGMKKTDGKKRSGRVSGIAKLEDANDAGGRNAQHCTLILTEGDSAKALAMSGLSVVGRDRFGVFPLRGKVLNVRDAKTTQITNNAEITNIKQILGLQSGKNYEDASSLRYGHVMIMYTRTHTRTHTSLPFRLPPFLLHHNREARCAECGDGGLARDRADQDHDGSHIKGLVVNLFAHFWPSLMRLPGFLTEFITPIVKVARTLVSLSPSLRCARSLPFLLLRHPSTLRDRVARASL